MTPRLLACALFAAGAMLLLSGSRPLGATHLRPGGDPLPLALFEASHFLASLVGLSLMLLANGVHWRVATAYHLSIVGLAAGAGLALLRGFDYPAAIALLAMLALLASCRRQFYRRAALIDERYTPAWTVAIGTVLLAWLGFGLFIHRERQYAHELWWEFTFVDDAPRFLRLGVGLTVALLIVASRRLLRPAPMRAQPLDTDSAARVDAIVAASALAAAHLAHLGDKSFLFSDDRRAFIMYASAGRSCVAMGDPIGDTSTSGQLVLRFTTTCHRLGVWPVFYEAGVDALPHYVDAGLTARKFGEDGRLRLAGFSLDGSAHRQQRYVLHAAERQGASFEVYPAERVAALLPELAPISEAWLRDKQTREKGFSLGRFDPTYLARCPLGLVRWRGAIVAFANLWCGAERFEISPDLMRYRGEGPDNVMEYLFLRLILWAKADGYQWFDLGMAPLAGLEAHAAAPLWNRLGALAFRHGEHFYHFQGLRQFKEKFHPEWRPKYIIYPGGTRLAHVLANIATLVSGGLSGAVRK